jgi:hypothetical protein
MGKVGIKEIQTARHTEPNARKRNNPAQLLMSYSPRAYMTYLFRSHGIFPDTHKLRFGSQFVTLPLELFETPDHKAPAAPTWNQHWH